MRGRAVWLPGIAADEQGRVVVTYYATDDSTATTTAARMLIATAVGSRDLAAPWSPPVALTAQFVPDQGQSVYGGDYMSTISVPRGVLAPGATFMSVWAETDRARFPLAPDRLRLSDVVVAP